MTPHNNASKFDYAKTVLMPGDPIRAKHIALEYLKNVKLINDVRGCFGYTGIYNGKNISLQASGMGQPSLGIYATELFDVYGVEKIIRLGTCGTFQKNINVGDILIPLSALTDSTITKINNQNLNSSPCCDYILLKQIMMKFENSNITKQVMPGYFMSSDLFYNEDKNWWEKYKKLGVMGVDMETHYLYHLALMRKKQAITINIVSNHLETSEELSPSERVEIFDNTIKIILEAL